MVELLWLDDEVSDLSVPCTYKLEAGLPVEQILIEGLWYGMSREVGERRNLAEC